MQARVTIMDDTLRNVAIGLAAFLVLHVSLEQRAKRGAEQQVFESFNRTGHVQRPFRAAWMVRTGNQRFLGGRCVRRGLEDGSAALLCRTRKGWKGSIRHLRLHLKRLTLAGSADTRF